MVRWVTNRFRRTADRGQRSGCGMIDIAALKGTTVNRVGAVRRWMLAALKVC